MLKYQIEQMVEEDSYLGNAGGTEICIRVVDVDRRGTVARVKIGRKGLRVFPGQKRTDAFPIPWREILEQAGVDLFFSA